MDMNKTLYKYYREGYNNPSHFDQNILLQNKTVIAEAVIKGICDRKRDILNNCYKPKQ